MNKYYLVCYHIDGMMSPGNCVIKDEDPLEFIVRINGEREIINLVNFWEITKEQFDMLSTIPTNILIDNLPSFVYLRKH